MANNWRKDEIDGDLLVDGNIECGGALHAAGDAAIGGDVVVGGVLRARNLVTPNKGWYESARALKAELPDAELHSYALVGDAPGAVWRKDSDGWVPVDDDTQVGEQIRCLGQQIADAESRIDAVLRDGRRRAEEQLALLKDKAAGLRAGLAAYAAALTPLVDASALSVLRFWGFDFTPSDIAPIVFDRKEACFRFHNSMADREPAYQSWTTFGHWRSPSVNADVLYLCNGELFAFNADTKTLVTLSPCEVDVVAMLDEDSVHSTTLSGEASGGLPAIFLGQYEGVASLYANKTIYVGGERNSLYDVGDVTDAGDCPILKRGVRFGTIVTYRDRVYAYTSSGLMRIDSDTDDDGRVMESRLPVSAHDLVLFDGVVDSAPQSWHAPMPRLFVGAEGEQPRGTTSLGPLLSFDGVVWCEEAKRFVVAFGALSAIVHDDFVKEWGDKARWMNGETPWRTKLYVNSADGALWRWNGDSLVQI